VCIENRHDVLQVVAGRNDRNALCDKCRDKRCVRRTVCENNDRTIEEFRCVLK
jgi:hypothetical protein